MEPVTDVEVLRRGAVGDRAVAIAGFIAILATGFFGDDPDLRAPQPEARASSAAVRTGDPSGAGASVAGRQH